MAELFLVGRVKRTIGLIEPARLVVLVTPSWPLLFILLDVVTALYKVSLVIALGHRCRTLTVMQLFTDSLI